VRSKYRNVDIKSYWYSNPCALYVPNEWQRCSDLSAFKFRLGNKIPRAKAANGHDHRTYDYRTATENKLSHCLYSRFSTLAVSSQHLLLLSRKRSSCIGNNLVQVLKFIDKIIFFVAILVSNETAMLLID
jgi:hypothetical protein